MELIGGVWYSTCVHREAPLFLDKFVWWSDNGSHEPINLVHLHEWKGLLFVWVSTRRLTDHQVPKLKNFAGSDGVTAMFFNLKTFAVWHSYFWWFMWECIGSK